MMVYILKSALVLALLYSCFFFLLSKETFHRLNRIMLNGFMLAALIVPLFHVTTQHPTVITEEVYAVQTFIEEEPVVAPLQEVSNPVTWIQVIWWVYLAGFATMLVITLLQTISLLRFMRGGLRHTDSEGNTVILQRGKFPPFSIFKYIVMTLDDYEHHRHYILAHEQEHIRRGHTADLMLLQVMKIIQWFNPFIWFLSRDLKAVHEYEADQAVINQGIDAKSYQQLLVMKVVGNRLQPFTNNLNHGSLKKRIIMMYQQPSNRWLMLKALCAIPVVALTINAFATPEPIMTDPVEDIVKTLENKEVEIPTMETMLFTLQESTQKEVSSHPLWVVNGNMTDWTYEVPLWMFNDDMADRTKAMNSLEAYIPQITNIPSNAIESITIIKPKMATVKWGSKGENGVIEIVANVKKHLAAKVAQGEIIYGHLYDNDGPVNATISEVTKDYKTAIQSVSSNTIGEFQLKVIDPDNRLLITSPNHQQVKQPIAQTFYNIHMQKTNPSPVTPDIKPGDIVTGNVKTEEGEPLKMVNVFERDEYGRVCAHGITDNNGDFAIKVVDPNHSITVSYVGRKTKTLKITDLPKNIVLEEATLLQDISVVGNRSGVNEKEPLIVVDGKVVGIPADIDVSTFTPEQMEKLLGIDSNGIESITVLKDAAAKAIWGERGTNGVIEIKTKKSIRDTPIDSIMSRLPGAEIDEKGQIRIYGKEVKKILIDGKEVYNVKENNGVMEFQSEENVSQENLIAILKRIPGINISYGKITINGKPVTRILANGNEVYNSTDSSKVVPKVIRVQ